MRPSQTGRRRKRMLSSWYWTKQALADADQAANPEGDPPVSPLFSGLRENAFRMRSKWN
jgi:hypothetical protein